MKDRFVDSCPLCGSREKKSLWKCEKEGAVNSICLSCGHVYISVMPSQKSSYASFEQSYSDSYLLSPDNYLNQLASMRVDLLLELIGNAREEIDSILEIGCGYGHFLSAITKLSNEILRVGIEPSKKQTKFLKRYMKGIKVYNGAFQDSTDFIRSTLGDRKFSIIASFHVLEHLSSPVEFMEFVESNIRNHGYLMIAVPNAFTISPDLIELYFMCSGMHLHIFHPFTLRKLIISFGFNVLYEGEEPITSALRSSYLILAEKCGDVSYSVENFGVSDIEYIEEIRSALEDTYKKMRCLISNIKACFSVWCSEKKKVYIYGGGIHTKALLETVDISRSCVEGIIEDDENKVGGYLEGIRVVSYDIAIRDNPDIIVVSSLSHESSILERIGNYNMACSIVGIYRDIAKGIIA